MGINDIVIVNEVQTAAGGFRRGLKDISAQDLGALVIKEVVMRVSISPETVDEVIIGQVRQVAEDGFMGRAVSLKAGLPQETTVYSVNRQCGSGLQIIVEVITEIQTGQADVCVTCGTENVSRLPYYIKDAWQGARMGHKVFENGVIDILTWSLDPYHNGVTAENTAEQCHVSREEQGAFALKSYKGAMQTIRAGRFKDEIVPVELKDKKGNITIFGTSEGPREDLTIEKLQKLKLCFVKSGTVTAGNASSLNNGAGAVVIMSDEGAKELGYRPLLIIRGYAVAGNDEAVIGYAPKLSNEELAAKLGLDLTSIGVVEINETFTSQAYAMRRDLGLGPERMNVYGGGISIDHPIDATGVILAVKIMYRLRRTDREDAMVSMCIGGGQGISMYFTKSE